MSIHPSDDETDQFLDIIHQKTTFLSQNCSQKTFLRLALTLLQELPQILLFVQVSLNAYIIV